MKKIILALVIIVIGIQFIPVKRPNPAVASDFDGPTEVKAILQRSCYDCHSNETKWPWYSRVAPVSWMLGDHVKEGRKHLNFSDWVPIRGNMHVREEIVEEIEKGKMPMKSYLLIHRDAAITPRDLDVLKKWAGK